MNNTQQNINVLYLVITFIVIIVSQSGSDVLFDKKEKGWSKVVECIYVVLFLQIAWLSGFCSFSESVDQSALYLFIRMAIYDPSYNIMYGHKFNYIGTTTPVYDRVMRKISNPVVFIAYRIFFILMAVLVAWKIMGW